MRLPTFDDLINPLLRALHLLGGSGSVEEIYNKVVEVERLPDNQTRYWRNSTIPGLAIAPCGSVTCVRSSFASSFTIA